MYASVVSAYPMSRLAELRLKKLRKPKAFLAVHYFEPGGPLPVGWFAGGIDICLRVDGNNPDSWSMSLLRAKTNQLHNLMCRARQDGRRLFVVSEWRSTPSQDGRVVSRAESLSLDASHAQTGTVAAGLIAP